MTTEERAPYEGMVAELVPFQGHNGDTIYGYEARPSGPGPFPGGRGNGSRARSRGRRG